MIFSQIILKLLFLRVVIFSLQNTWNSLFFHCSNTCRVDLVAIMEVVCLNLLITSFSLRSCHANIMPSTNGCTSLRSDSSIPCRRSWSDKYSTIIWSALIECSMAKGTCLFIPSVSVFIADFSGGGSFYLFPFHSHCCCGLVLWYFSYFVSFMVLFWLMRCKYAAKVHIILDITIGKVVFFMKYIIMC